MGGKAKGACEDVESTTNVKNKKRLQLALGNRNAPPGIKRGRAGRNAKIVGPVESKEAPQGKGSVERDTDSEADGIDENNKRSRRDLNDKDVHSGAEPMKTNKGEEKESVKMNKGEEKEPVKTNKGDEKEPVKTNKGEEEEPGKTNKGEEKEPVKTNTGEEKELVTTNKGEETESAKKSDSAGGDSKADDGIEASQKHGKPNPQVPLKKEKGKSRPNRDPQVVQLISTPSFDFSDMVGNTSEDFQINVAKALECIRQEQQRLGDSIDQIKAVLLTILETKAQRKPIPCNAVDEFLSPPEDLQVAESEVYMGGNLKLNKSDVTVILQGTIELQTKIEQLLSKLYPQKSYNRFYLQASKGELFPQDICVAIYNLVSLTDPSATISLVRSKLSKIFDKTRPKV